MQINTNCKMQLENSLDIFYGDYKNRKKTVDKLLNIPDNFDLLHREFIMGGKRVTLYAIDGFLKGELAEKVMEFFYSIEEKDMPQDFQGFVEKGIPFVDIIVIKDQKKFIQMLLSGMSCMLLEGYQEMIAIDFREYPQRSVDEPEKDKVLRGSRDGFVENIMSNVAMIRRRIRDVNLQFRILNVGKSSKTDVTISYMKGRVREDQIKEILKRIDNIQVDALSMNQESLAEILFPRNWWNPFPKFKYTERPDTAAACLLEGSVVVIVDNSPAVMILPTSLFSILEDANDYYFPPVTGTYLRLTRILTSITAIFLTPLFLLFVEHPEYLCDGLKFFLPKEQSSIPPLFQFLILEFAIDGLKMASVNSPSMLATPLSIVAGIVFGDYTVSSGFFSPEIMLFMAFVAVANYTQSNMELAYAIKFHRVIILVLTAFFGLAGFTVGTVFLILMFLINPTLIGRGYMYPFVPWDGKQLLKRFFRVTLPYSEKSNKKM